MCGEIWAKMLDRSSSPAVGVNLRCSSTLPLGSRDRPWLPGLQRCRWHQYPKWNDGLTLLTSEKPKSTTKRFKREKKHVTSFLTRRRLCPCPAVPYTTNTGRVSGL